MPNLPAARRSSTGSPDGSAAASWTSRRAWTGKVSSCRRKPSSIRPDRGAASGRPNPPASSVGVNARGSSSSASGLPCVSAMIRSRTRGSSGPGSAESSSARASSSRSPSTTSSGNPASSCPGPAGREHQADRISSQPACHEPQRLHRSAIEPLLVVDDADQRPLPGNLGQETQHGQTDQEPVGRRAGVDAERGPQRIVLRTGNRSTWSNRGAQSWCRPANANSISDCTPTVRATRHPCARSDQVVQQHGLAHAGIPVHHQRPALTVADRLDQAVEHVAFPTPVRQPGRTPSKPEVRRHPTGTTPLRCGRPRPVDGGGPDRTSWPPDPVRALMRPPPPVPTTW